MTQTNIAKQKVCEHTKRLILYLNLNVIIINYPLIAKSLGHTAFVPENDMYSRTKSELLAQMDVAMGGRVAEELSMI